MGIDPVRYSSEGFDLRNRFVQSAAVIASPAAAAETIIAQLTIAEGEQLEQGVWLSGWAAFTVGTSGTAVRFRIRRTNVAGAVVADTGALTGGIAATNLCAQDVEGVDTGAVLGGQTYVLTMQVTAGAAASTVSAVTLKAVVV